MRSETEPLNTAPTLAGARPVPALQDPDRPGAGQCFTALLSQSSLPAGMLPSPLSQGNSPLGLPPAELPAPSLSQTTQHRGSHASLVPRPASLNPLRSLKHPRTAKSL